MVVRGTVLVTGAEGLIGTALSRALQRAGYEVVPFDVRRPLGKIVADIRSPESLRQAMAYCSGVVHLAAVSRVVWGERDPELCWETNAVGTERVVEAACQSPERPWVVFSSSREVYGQADLLPVTEEHPVHPINVYGRAKVAAEAAVDQARARGLGTAVLRFSNVYGSTDDHVDRVVPAFVRAALAGEALRVDGAEHTFDFTHLDDTVRGITRVIEALEAGERALPTLQLVTGTPTTLRQLAELTIELCQSPSPLEEAPPRSFDVSRFYGSYARSEQVLGWRPELTLREGLERLADGFRRKLALGVEESRAPGTNP